MDVACKCNVKRIPGLILSLLLVNALCSCIHTLKFGLIIIRARG
jgi:hypothetical protein